MAKARGATTFMSPKTATYLFTAFFVVVCSWTTVYGILGVGGIGGVFLSGIAIGLLVLVAWILSWDTEQP
jgi:hypothetical protein